MWGGNRGIAAVVVLFVVLGSPAVALGATQDGQTLTVPASANVYASGMDEPPDVFGGGGTVPPSVSVADADTVTFPAVEGRVASGSTGFPATGPEGYVDSDLPERARGGMDVRSYEGVSGIVHGERAFFLVGVFLTDERPTPPAPERRNFTGNDSFERLSPAVGQVFFVGDGRTDDGTVQEFVVPDGATRLYLGFADAAWFEGEPGTYGDNSGNLTVTVDTGTGEGGGGSNPLPGFTALVALVGVVAGLYGLARSGRNSG